MYLNLEDLKINNGKVTLDYLDVGEDEYDKQTTNKRKEDIRNIAKIMIIHKIENGGVSMFYWLVTALSLFFGLIFPPLFIIPIWYWTYLFINRNKHYLILGFLDDGEDENNIRTYIFNKEEEEILKDKIFEIKNELKKYDKKIKVEKLNQFLL